MRGPILEQLRQALHPALDRVTVTWNFEGPEQPPAAPAGGKQRGPGLDPSPTRGEHGIGGGPAAGRVQQLVPSRPHAVFAGERFLSFAIFEPVPGGGPLPRSVTVTAAWAASSAPLGPLSTTVAMTERDVCRGDAAHKLAAREAIRALEEWGAGAGAGGRAAIVRLAMAQSATALVAVDAATARAVSTAEARTEAGQGAVAPHTGRPQLEVGPGEWRAASSESFRQSQAPGQFQGGAGGPGDGRLPCGRGGRRLPFFCPQIGAGGWRPAGRRPRHANSQAIQARPRWDRTGRGGAVRARQTRRLQGVWRRTRSARGAAWRCSRGPRTLRLRRRPGGSY
jgi:hypothetical protein